MTQNGLECPPRCHSNGWRLRPPDACLARPKRSLLEYASERRWPSTGGLTSPTLHLCNPHLVRLVSSMGNCATAMAMTPPMLTAPLQLFLSLSQRGSWRGNLIRTSLRTSSPIQVLKTTPFHPSSTACARSVLVSRTCDHQRSVALGANAVFTCESEFALKGQRDNAKSITAIVEDNHNTRTLRALSFTS